MINKENKRSVLMGNAGKQFQVKDGSTVLVRGAADVCLLGWDNPDVKIDADGDNSFQVEQENDLIRVFGRDDLQVSVPSNVIVRLESSGGDTFISDIVGTLDVQKTGGDAWVEGCSRVDFGMVGGDLHVRDISGPMTVQRVGGDFDGEVSGPLTIEGVGGDVRVQIAGGSVRVRSGGDLEANLIGSEGEEAMLKAGGDIQLYVPAALNARLDLSSGGADIHVDVNGQNISTEQGDYVLVLGEGKRQIRARAGGDINVTDHEWKQDGLEQEFARLEDAWDHWKTGVDAPESWMNMEERIRSRAEAATRRAEHSTRRAERRVKAAMERVDRQTRFRDQALGQLGSLIGFASQTRNPVPPTAPEMPQPGNPRQANAANAVVEPSAVSNDERMVVLKMLQEHKITVDEAEKLLSALEGQFE
jgi:hypothetical protein